VRGVLGVHHVALTVRDLDASANFYESLGFALERRLEFDGPGAERVTGVPGASLEMAFLMLDGVRLELIRFDPAGEQRVGEINDLGTAHICLEVNEIGRVHSELAARGARFVSPPYHHPSGVSMAYFGDPDGNLVELLQIEGSDGD
jgi:catechol 2,3-dioxygenase-like lactoylglutathione lyase family enzyme